MKKIFRNFVFYTAALYIVSLIIPGFDLAHNLQGLLLCGITFTLVFFLVHPLLKLLLLPLNLLTLGLFSFFTQVITVYIYLYLFPNFIKISTWQFAGFNFDPLGISIAPFMVPQYLTIFVATFIISFVVSTLAVIL